MFPEGFCCVICLCQQCYLGSWGERGLEGNLGHRSERVLQHQVSPLEPLQVKLSTHALPTSADKRRKKPANLCFYGSTSKEVKNTLVLK